jgi:uncharacterized protein YuzE
MAPDPGALAQPARESELDGPQQEAGQEALEAGEVDQRKPGVRIDLDQEIDVARRPSLTAGGRAEQCEAGNAAPSDVVGVGTQQQEDALALGVLVPNLCSGDTRHDRHMIAQIGLRQVWRAPPMKLTYDSRHNVAYVRLREQWGQVGTIRVSDGLSIDLAHDGTIYGIELLNANEQLRGGDDGRIVVVDGAGERALALPSGPRS